MGVDLGGARELEIDSVTLGVDGLILGLEDSVTDIDGNLDSGGDILGDWNWLLYGEGVMDFNNLSLEGLDGVGASEEESEEDGYEEDTKVDEE